MIGSPSNDNFLGTLELLLILFLAAHLEKYGNKGKGFNFLPVFHYM